MAAAPNEHEIERFVSETHTSRETARFCLELANGNYERALEQYYEMEPRNGAIVVGQNPQQNAAQVHRRGLFRGMFRLLTEVVLLPIGVLRFSFRICRVVIGHSLSATAQLLLPSAVQDRYVATNGAGDPPSEASDFTRLFRNQYGFQHPNFVELGWKEAAREAEIQSKFLFAYLHSPQHDDTDEFCSSVLTSSEIINFLNQHFICWAGSIDRSPAFTLASNLGATTYPFICVLSYTENETTMMTAIQGNITGPRLISLLQQTLNDHGATMMQQRIERDQHEIDRQIRADQDLEYQRALEADRERDRRNREAAAIVEAQEQAKQRQLEQERLEREQDVQRQITKDRNIQDRRTSKSASLTPEPETGSNAVQIRIRLPDGTTHNRRFLNSTKISEVYDFVDSLDQLSCWDYTLASSYPRFEFGLETRSQTLRDLDFVHSVMLLVQSNDD